MQRHLSFAILCAGSRYCLTRRRMSATDALAYDICAVIPVVEGVGGSVCHTGKQQSVTTTDFASCFFQAPPATTRLWSRCNVQTPALPWPGRYPDAPTGSRFDRISLSAPEKCYSSLVCLGMFFATCTVAFCLILTFHTISSTYHGCCATHQVHSAERCKPKP